MGRATPETRDAYYELRPLLTNEEALEFLKLSRVEREEWLRKFWKSKDPTPPTERNEFKEEHEKRVEYAKANFGSNFTMRPWDDRGEVYIKYGEPRVQDALSGKIMKSVSPFRVLETKKEGEKE